MTPHQRDIVDRHIKQAKRDRINQQIKDQNTARLAEWIGGNDMPNRNEFNLDRYVNRPPLETYIWRGAYIVLGGLIFAAVGLEIIFPTGAFQ